MSDRTPALRPARAAVAALGAAGLVTLGLGALPAGAYVDDDGDVVIDLVGINDFHGQLSREVNSDGAVTQAGAVALASAVQDAREANEDTVFVSAGTNFGASTSWLLINDTIPTIEGTTTFNVATTTHGN